MRLTTLIAMAVLWMVGLTGCKKSVTCIRGSMCYSAKEKVDLKDEKRTYYEGNVVPYLVERGWKVLSYGDHCVLEAPKKYDRPCAKVLEMVQSAEVHGAMK